MAVAVISSLARPWLEARLPDGLDLRWFTTAEELHHLAPEAEIGWFDAHGGDLRGIIRRAGRLRWLNTIAAGVESFPLDLLGDRGVVLTNGAGLNAAPIAEYVVMGMLAVAKGLRQVFAAGARGEWLQEAPGKGELSGSRALILGAGAIGSAVAERLAPFGVEVVKVRRNPGPGEIGPADWRGLLGTFDWILVAVPATAATERLIGAAELAAMRPDACLLNVARGMVIDQAALVEALRHRRLGHAVLDVTDPEPLPPDHPLWTLPNATVTMHLSGRSQTGLLLRGADRFLANLALWQRGEALAHRVDLAAGY
jgi:phosphoglycerate dehydrogenase-like enzyme